jgi:TetR/AcrR family transcriptional regulator
MTALGAQRTPPSTATGRTQILRAALPEFAERGYAGATTASIARRAGVTQPLVHHHFGSKLELYRAAVADVFADLEAQQTPLLRAVKGLEAKTIIRVAVRQFILFSGQRPELVRLMMMESARDSENARYIVETHVQPMARRFQRYLKQGVAEGSMRQLDERLLHFLVMGAASYLSLVPVEADVLFGVDATTTTVVERYADLVVDVLFHGISKNDGPRV